MKKSLIIYLFLLLSTLSSCSPHYVSILRSSNMDKLKLGMSKEQVTNVLGNSYTIAEKRVEDGKTIEILSYRNFPNSDEFYLFRFKNNNLEEWHRELLPKYEFTDK